MSKKERKASLKELVELDELQAIQNSFAKNAGTSSVIFLPDGEPLTQFSNPTSFCSLIQSTDEGKRRCFQSFRAMSQKAFGLRAPKILYCFAHGAHFVAPIIINGERKGTMFAGQFIPRMFSPDELKELEKTAAEINLDPQLLVEEAKKMRVVEENVAWNYSSLLFLIVNIIAKLGVHVEERTAELKARAKDLEKARLASLNIAQDLKKAKKKEEKAKEELKAKNAELERFTYAVSHSLRSPLITVQGYVKLLREDFEQNEKEKVESDLEYIENIVTKMDRLLNDTLYLSRIGRVTNPPEDVPFVNIVHGALEQTAGQIKSSGVEVSVAEEFPTVHVDRMRIAEVLVNLITNSINYRGEQPYPKIDIAYRVDGEETVFFVKDNGIGIDKSQHEKVFVLFHRVDKSSKGTGAGLAIVKRIIEVHGGRIWIESEKDKGCTVCFTLHVS